MIGGAGFFYVVRGVLEHRSLKYCLLLLYIFSQRVAAERILVQLNKLNPVT